MLEGGQSLRMMVFAKGFVIGSLVIMLLYAVFVPWVYGIGKMNDALRDYLCVPRVQAEGGKNPSCWKYIVAELGAFIILSPGWATVMIVFLTMTLCILGCICVLTGMKRNRFDDMVIVGLCAGIIAGMGGVVICMYFVF